MKPVHMFVLGCIISPLVLMFGKLIIFAAGVVAIIATAIALTDIIKEDQKKKEVVKCSQDSP